MNSRKSLKHCSVRLPSSLFHFPFPFALQNFNQMEIIDPNRANIVRQLVSSCLQWKEHEKDVMKIVTSGLHASSAVNRKHLFKLLLFLTKFEDMDRIEKKSINQIGSVIIQGLMLFSSNLSKSLVDRLILFSLFLLSSVSRNLI